MNVKDSLARARKQAKGGQRGTRLKASSSNSASTSTVSPLFRADKTLDALYENMEVLTGQRGEGAAVVMVTDSSGNCVPFYPDGSGGTTDGSGSGSDSGGDGRLTPAYPSTPTGLVVNGGFSVVELDWDAPVYYGHSLTQIWRCPEDNLSEAVQVGSTAANIYSDPIDPVYEGYYWIRFVNSDGVTGPYNASEGTYVKTQESTDDIINVINDTINDSPLIVQLQAGLDGVQEQITTIDSEGTQAFQNMWSVKASADGITAGIGLVAGVDDEGEPISQVAVAATQFFVFDPNNPNPDGTMEALFYVDADYGVCMQKAVIEQATIQVLNAQTIVADEVTAGIEIDSPDIKGGQIEIGNGFSVDSSGNMTANNATLNDVTLNRVTANEGQFNNVTISEDCVIEGTLSANQIKGDIVNAVGFSIGISGSRRIEIIDDQEFDRTVMIPAVSMNCESHDHEEYDHTVSGGASIQMEISINGTAYATYSASCSGNSSGAGSASLAYDFIMGTGDLIIDITVTNSTYYGSVSISDVVLMVAKKGSGGIIVS
ncbi:phage tail tip domain-containing protein [Citrobacter freundii]|uniref:phage tail tip domain-containing protein n=1 Tax=Citrobacter freundii TaxID=546 RepID=UPI00374E3EF0